VDEMEVFPAPLKRKLEYLRDSLGTPIVDKAELDILRQSGHVAVIEPISLWTIVSKRHEDALADSHLPA
jgi:hypothetical protein